MALPPRKDIQMNQIYEILDLIKIRPAMYIRHHCITSLYSFQNGYSMALKRLSIEDHTDTLLFPFWFFMSMLHANAAIMNQPSAGKIRYWTIPTSIRARGWIRFLKRVHISRSGKSPSCRIGARVFTADRN